MNACIYWTSTGARVSIAYPTCLLLENTPLKGGLILNTFINWHHAMKKDLSVIDGDASD